MAKGVAVFQQAIVYLLCSCGLVITQDLVLCRGIARGDRAGCIAGTAHGGDLVPDSPQRCTDISEPVDIGEVDTRCAAPAFTVDLAWRRDSLVFQVVQRAQGFMGGAFNTREFFHGHGPATLGTVRLLFIVLVFVAPLVLLGASYLLTSPYLPIAAFVVQYLGLLAERWCFFAEASHPQNLYYQSMA